VGPSEGRSLAKEFSATFREVSVADGPAETVAAMNDIVRELWRKKVRLARMKTLSFARVPDPQ